MSDRDVQREIEANERRVRDEQDVGLDEDVLRDADTLDDEGGVLPDLLDLDLDEDQTRDEEYDDNTRATDDSA